LPQIPTNSLFMNAVKLVLNLVLVLASAFLVYKLVATIQEPITFQAERAKRDAIAIERLKQARSTQLAFKSKYNRYCSSFDSLITMIKTDSFEVVKVIGDPNDSTVVVKKETFKRSMLDSLFNGNAQALEQMPYIPFSPKNNKFNIQAATINRNNTDIPAFEISGPLKEIYAGLPSEYYADRYNENMRVGNINDGTTSGSWDK